ncbi:MAG TPA: DUF427 domain-containing protein [Gemmatimonadetes bacterium]|nr:DUF427 domain-containing protein [Gemmatimonadota bacterium]
MILLHTVADCAATIGERCVRNASPISISWPHAGLRRISGLSCRCRAGAETSAEASRVLIMFESNHLPVYYFPRSDVRMNLMERNDHSCY